jgi:hypothetical protein
MWSCAFLVQRQQSSQRILADFWEQRAHFNILLLLWGER